MSAPQSLETALKRRCKSQRFGYQRAWPLKYCVGCGMEFWTRGNKSLAGGGSCKRCNSKPLCDTCRIDNRAGKSYFAMTALERKAYLERPVELCIFCEGVQG